MRASTRTKILNIVHIGKRWTMVENMTMAVIFVLAILFFFGYAIYSAAHHVRF